MSKSLGFSLLMCMLSTIAAAETSVSLYGVIDEGITVSKYKHQAATLRETSGNYYTSRFGIKAAEDLGGGTKVGFNLLQSFKVNTGEKMVPGEAFGFESVLTLEGKWGKFAFGRAGGLTSDYADFSIFGGAVFTTCFQIVGNVLSAFTLTDLVNNSLIYISPEWEGLKLHLMYSNGMESDTNRWSSNAHYYGIGFTYSKDKFNTDLVWEALDNKDRHEHMTSLLNLGASYDFGFFTLYGAYENTLNAMVLPGYVDLDNYVSSIRNGANSNAFSLSVGVPAGGGTIMLQGQFAFGKIKDKVVSGTNNFNTWSIGLAYLYPISKRTNFYADIAYGSAGQAMKTADELCGWNATIGMNFQF